MINQIGTKVYYCTITGNVLRIIGDMEGYVIEPTFEEDCGIYEELRGRGKSTIGTLRFEYGKYPKMSYGSTGVRVNLETKELIFSYDELPIPPQEPSEIEILSNKISILEKSQTGQDTEILNNMLATTEVFEMVLTMASSPETISLKDTKNNKNTGGNSMVEVYATLILKGFKTIEDVPVIIRAQVAERLRQLEVPVK